LDFVKFDMLFLWVPVGLGRQWLKSIFVEIQDLWQ